FRPILMTSFAFVAGLIPLIMAHGAGAIGNRTIGGSALGGMLLGTIFGVIIIPGLYYIFANLAKGSTLINGEESEPLSESYVRTSEEQSKTHEDLKKTKSLLKKILSRKNKK